MFFGRLSIFREIGALQLLRKAARVLGEDCGLCGARCGGAIICGACASGFPRSALACPRCALPMVLPETCGRCLRHPPAFDSALAAFDYRFPVDRLVRRFKFGGDLALGRWLAFELARCARTGPLPHLLAVPPLTRARLRTRGFNQALEMARVVGAELGVRVEARLVERLRDTTPQPGLGFRARHANLRGVFRCERDLRGLSVAIVDDVMTTGATAQAVTGALREAGAERVAVWVAARTPEPRR
jgi:ComF family protein